MDELTYDHFQNKLKQYNYIQIKKFSLILEAYNNIVKLIR